MVSKYPFRLCQMLFFVIKRTFLIWTLSKQRRLTERVLLYNRLVSHPLGVFLFRCFRALNCQKALTPYTFIRFIFLIKIIFSVDRSALKTFFDHTRSFDEKKRLFYFKVGIPALRKDILFF